MKVLSLFDGISVAQQALKSLGIDCEVIKHILKTALNTLD